jgi:DnaJ-class molecular chaperone
VKEESDICPTCNGYGKYQQEVEDGEMVTIESVFCETCNGTGRINVSDGDFD